MKPLIAYIKKLIETNSKESSKRFIALYCMLLISFIVLMYTSFDNAVNMMSALLSFVAILVGVSSWQAIKTNQNNKE